MRISAKTWLPLLGAGLAASCLAGPARAVDADKAIPADAEAVAFINVRQVLDSPLYVKYGKDDAETGLQDPKIKKLLDAVGVNPLKDVDSILLTAAGDLGDNPKTLIVVRGTFDPAKIQAAAEDYATKQPNDLDLKITKVDDLTIYEGKAKDKKFYATVRADGKTVLASGDKDYLLQNVQHPSTGPSKEMTSALSKVPGKECVWMAAVVTDKMNNDLAKMPQTKDLAGKLECVTGSIDVTHDLTTQFFIHTTDTTSAADLKRRLTQLKPLLSILAAGANEDAAPVLQDLVENLKITTDENSVKVSLKVTEEQIEKAGKSEKPEKPVKPVKPEKPVKPDNKDK